MAITGNITATVTVDIDNDGFIAVVPWSNGVGHGKMWFDAQQARDFAKRIVELADELDARGESCK